MYSCWNEPKKSELLNFGISKLPTPPKPNLYSPKLSESPMDTRMLTSNSETKSKAYYMRKDKKSREKRQTSKQN